jgi:hypothetical protein
VIVVYVECVKCRHRGDCVLPQHAPDGFLACPHCNAPVQRLGLGPGSIAFIERITADKAEQQRRGRLFSRKQSHDQSDEQIDREGLGAELAACLMLAPNYRQRWTDRLLQGGNNRGRDLPAEWTRLDKPIEVKQTRYAEGHLIVRPPRNTPGRWRDEFLDDSYYVLLTGGRDYFYWLRGWCDRAFLLSHGKRNPVPVGADQRECWGIHCSKLLPIVHLASPSPRRVGTRPAVAPAPTSPLRRTPPRSTRSSARTAIDSRS